MIRWDLLPDVLTLIGAFALTWPALRAGRMLGLAANAAGAANKAREPTGAGIFRRIQRAYLAKSWRPSDQRWLWSGLFLSLSGGLWALVLKWHALAIVPH